jgi:hypothetical protein
MDGRALMSKESRDPVPFKRESHWIPDRGSPASGMRSGLNRFTRAKIVAFAVEIP